MDKTSRNILFRSIILMIIICVIIETAVAILGMDNSPMQRINQDDITGSITYRSGKVVNGLHPDEWRVSRGEVINATIKLPEKKPYDSVALCFTVYNSEVEVEFNGQSLYSYGHDLAENNQQIGNILVTFTIPDYAWGRSLHLTIKEQEKTKTLQNSAYNLVPSERAGNYAIIGHGLEFVVFFVLMIVGLAIVLTGIVFVADRKNRRLTVSIGLASFLLSCWYMGYNRFFYAISANIRVNAMIEYYTLDLVSLPIIVFVYLATDDKKKQKLIRWVGIFVTTYTLGTIVLAGFHVLMLSDALPGLQVILGIQLVILMWLVISGFREKSNPFAAALLIGITTGMIFAVLEIIAIRVRNINGFPHVLLRITSFNYASVGLAILILTMIIGVVEKLYYDIRTKAEQEELEKIAYIDQLTGIPNRISCTNHMKELTEKDWYAVAFFDVDGLKKANDNYGHDVGDALINEAAGLIKIAFGDMNGFYGRWGGDEFVAVFRDRADLKRFEPSFEKFAAYLASKHTLPIPFSISVGYEEHLPGDKANVNDIVNKADEKMYYTKKKKKAERRD